MAKIIYLVTNEDMPGLVKIGFAENLDDRLKALSNHPGVPGKYYCYFAAKVDDARVLEKKLHAIFHDQRTNHKREFFRIDPEKAKIAISIGIFEEVKPTVRSKILKQKNLSIAMQKSTQVKEVFANSFDIVINETLTFSRSNSISAIYLGENQVKFQGEEMSLSKAAIIAGQQQGGTATSLSGPKYWTYKGESLFVRRKRLSRQFLENVEQV